MIINRGLYPTGANYRSVTNLQDRFETLQIQLATGKRASSLTEMGSSRTYDLTLRSRLGRVEGYQSSIQMVNLRLDFFDNVLSRLTTLESDVRNSAAPGGYGSDGIHLATAPSLAQSRLEEVVSLYNTDVAGRHLFGGSATQDEPVVSASEMLNGANGRDGFKTLVAERHAADAGADGLGRLELDQTLATVTLNEDGSHIFGFKLSTLSSDSSGITLTAPTGDPATLEVEFTGTVLDGEEVIIGLTLPDGNETVISLTARTSAEEPGDFEIGATDAATAANFSAALQAAILEKGQTDLDAASKFEMADAFFNGSGETVMRVDGPPFESATALKVADAADTMFWYNGDDNSGDPRSSVSARIDDGTKVDYGVQANEGGLAELVRVLAVMASENFPESDESSEGRFDYIAIQQRSRLSQNANSSTQSLEVITLELGIVRSTLGNADERHTAYGHQLENMLADLEQAPIEEVAMEISAVQTRLQASYQTMSIISQLTLVNFIS